MPSKYIGTTEHVYIYMYTYVYVCMHMGYRIPSTCTSTSVHESTRIHAYIHGYCIRMCIYIYKHGQNQEIYIICTYMYAYIEVDTWLTTANTYTYISNPCPAHRPLNYSVHMSSTYWTEYIRMYSTYCNAAFPYVLYIHIAIIHTSGQSKNPMDTYKQTYIHT